MSVLDSALWITLIGMGLVFTAIVLLWGMMRLLVYAFRDRETKEDSPMELTVMDGAFGETSQSEQRKKAAAAAVAFCLAQEAAREAAMTPYMADIRSGDQSAAWQTIQRASEISQKTFQRNKKVQR